MDAITHRFFSYVLYISLLFGAVLLCFNDHYRILTLTFYVFFAALILYHHRRYYISDKKHPHGKYFLLAELFLALAIQYFDHTGFIELYLFIVLGDALLAYESRFSAPFSFFSMIAYIVILFLHSNAKTYGDFWREIDASLFLSLIYIAVIINARHNIITSRKNRRLANELEEKTKELEAANETLQNYAENIEETADLRVREKLMHELHDHLGHLLTTAVIGTQAASILIEKEPEAAKSRLIIVTEQIQAAMQSLRNVIRNNTILSEQNDRTFLQSMTILLNETEKRTGINIEHNLAEIPEKDIQVLTNSQQAYLYNALMEGLTNGIRHGAAICFQFELTQDNDTVHFSLRDNGKGFEELVPGFGLQKMQQEASYFGADLKIISSDGCILTITMPLEKTTTGKGGDLHVPH